MSWVTGTATDLMDFSDKLRDFLCNQGHAWGKTYAGTGDGTLSAYIGTSISVAEMFTITAINSTTFSVTGSITGALGNATVGTPYTSSVVNFLLTAGGTAFIAGDQFTLQTSPKWINVYYRGCVSGGSISDNRVGSNFDVSTANPIPRMFDGVVNNYAQSYGVPAHVSFTLHTVEQIGRVSFLNGSISEAPSSITLSYSDNNSTWTPLQTWSGITSAQAYERHDLDVTSPESHKYWRVIFNSAQAAGYVRVTELYLFKDANNNNPLHDYFRWHFRGPGLDGTKQINVNGIVWQDTPNDRHNWSCTSYGYHVIPLSNQPFTYHIIANGQRFIISASPSGVWVSGYFGYCLPYEPPSVQADPYVFGGSSDDWAQSLADTTSDMRAFFSPGYYLYAKYPDTAWRAHVNRYNSGSTSDGVGDNSQGKVYPWCQDGQGDMFSYEREQLDGGFALIPGVIHYNQGGVSHVLGEFDGVYYVTGFNNSAGTTISYGGFDHLVIKNIVRNNPQDFAALRLD